MKRLVLASFIFLVLSGCRKNREVVVMGAITEGYIGHPVSGVSVEISFSELRNATYSLGYTILGTATTDSEGAYSYAFERVAAVNYRVRCTKDGYLLHEEIVHTDDWRVKTENMLDIEMFVESSLNFRLVNTSHPSSQVLLRLEEHSQGCDFCCSHDATIRVAGINDTSFSCNVFGNQMIEYKTTQITDVEAIERVYSLDVGPGENSIYIEY
ncbi:MAG: carboxypeptidase regulatory-like domain-containing protein [Flavobacteriales bacterium]|jgi:hypothetical protein|nr:carboxypeptidase regulatory-like domain-containing protein [Flavobacteriales bacterium]MBT3963799.1 carboxypeptidase regulatory-like domain-containing protein [Flavobacteriales bacterium]MBT4705420.1 carboxypeptidase regulatory-like domain-containing protein [Flavobacteriales bacterium]MBT4929829.1 carboxypeptidase regulatory-like domain-containing protein [Flavobacteriales bacterium]MBT5132203.1 carboxypeptidase regulatory-like domain-containing protein [Flavobacteriales bacterium]